MEYFFRSAVVLRALDNGLGRSVSVLAGMKFVRRFFVRQNPCENGLASIWECIAYVLQQGECLSVGVTVTPSVYVGWYLDGGRGKWGVGGGGY